MRRLRKCLGCGQYSLDQEHKCDAKTFTPHPAKYSPEDRYAKYRRVAKQREGLL